MPPAATSSSTTVLAHRRDNMSLGGDAVAVGFGANGNGEVDRSPKRPLPHIDDILSATVDQDPHAPAEKQLQLAETYMRQAESSRSFGRPDLALGDYIRASIIVVDRIKRNKGWESISTHKNQMERYQRLLRQVNAAHPDFERVKAEIKADNARTGVQPTVRRVKAGANGTAAGSLEGAGGRSHVNGAARDLGDASENGTAQTQKQKPAVHPKPQALHGNALKPVGAAGAAAGAPSSKTAQDLARRFANLRPTTASAAVQDAPARPVVVVPTVGSAISTSISQHEAGPFARNAFPELPRLPDAIYSPARGTVSSEAAELPSSTPRGIFSRTNSMASVGRNFKPQPSADYFTTPYSLGESTPARRSKPTIPEGDTISVADLVKYMKVGSKEVSILLVDLRSRDEFDEGHIMSQATICIEAEILMRENISANEIADSMVLAPATEQMQFERRHEYDLVVFYDQSSEQIFGNTNTAAEAALVSFYNALSQYDFSGSADRRKPKLLAGGLDAWTGLMGRVSLQTSSTASGAYTVAPQKAIQPVSSPRRMRGSLESGKASEEGVDGTDEFSPVRTTEDFLRRFPSVHVSQESMSPLYSPPPPETFYSSVPVPPTRPAPALPRPSHSGLADTESVAISTKAAIAQMLPPGDFRVGMNNPSNWCYAIATLQCLFSTIGFGDEIRTGLWQHTYHLPPSRFEKVNNPQILMKLLQSVFHYLGDSKSTTFRPDSFMGYLRVVHGKDFRGISRAREEIFGGDYQQDAHEFFSFLISRIHGETNRRRDRNSRVKVGTETVLFSTPLSPLQNSMMEWEEYSRANDSIIDQYFRGIRVNISVCRKCNDVEQRLEAVDTLDLDISGLISSPQQTLELEDILRNYGAREERPQRTCDKCNGERVGRDEYRRFARLPDRLVIWLWRFAGETQKIENTIRFPLTGLQLGDMMLEPKWRHLDAQYAAQHQQTVQDRHYDAGAVYDCYAVVHHIGKTARAGHYVAFVRNHHSPDGRDWLHLNDSRVTRIQVGGAGPAGRDATNRLYHDNNGQAYLIMYQRRGTTLST